MDRDTHMSTIIRKNSALVLTSLDPSPETTPQNKRFVDLLKACDIDAEIVNSITDINQAKMYDCIMLDAGTSFTIKRYIRTNPVCR